MSQEGVSDRPLPPGASGWPVLGETLAFLGGTFSFLADRVARHGLVFRTHLLGRPTVVLAGGEGAAAFADPALCERVGSMPPHVLALFGGTSLGALDGEAHRRGKDSLLQAFSVEAIGRYVPEMQPICEGAAGAWAAASPVEAVGALKRLSLTVIARNFVGLEPGPDLDVLLDGYEEILPGFTSLPLPFPGTAYQRALRARDALFEVHRRGIAAHRTARFDDGLARMLAYEADDKSTMSDDAALIEVHHAFVAGGIIYGPLCAALIELGRQPDLCARLRDEVAVHCPDGPITPRGLASLPLLSRVVAEIKRTTPVIPVVFARAKATFAVAGYRVPAGAMVAWAPYTHNQDPAVFADPTRFDPDRFAPPREEHLQRADAFAPHGIGAVTGHKCPATDYATVLLSVFMVVLLRGFAWELAPSVRGAPSTVKAPLFMGVRRRHASPA